MSYVRIEETVSIFTKRHSRPILSKEERTLRALETAFPSGEWVEIPVVGDGSPVPAAVAADEQKPPQRSQPGEGERVGTSAESPRAASPEAAPSLTIIGGTKYDEEALFAQVYERMLFFGTTIVTGDGRGAEQFALRIAKEQGGTSRQIVPDPLVYGKSARKVNVEQVLSYDPISPVLLVGNGERVKQAEAWLKRANWGREVIRIS